MVTVAEPLTKVTGLPIGVPLSLNCNVPLGVPLPGETTATTPVKVTDAPRQAGLSEEVIVTVVEAWLTVCPPLNEPVLAL